MRNAAKITALTMAETVNSVIHCKTIHHTMTFPFLIVRGLLERTHTCFGAQSL